MRFYENNKNQFMKKILWFIKVNKLRLGLIFTLFFLFLYVVIICKFIYDSKMQIELINIDLNNKSIEKEYLINEIVRLKTQQLPQEVEVEQEVIENITDQKKAVVNIIDNVSLNDGIPDSSLKKFVTSNISFNNRSYVPSNLVNISSEYVYDSKWWSQLLRSVANDALQAMAKQFFEDTWEKIVVVSAYRSYLYQKWIKDRGCPDNLCAKAGYSEHQSGLAVDLWEASTNHDWKINSKLQEYYKWLNENAHKYGFHNTYQKWLSIDWYEIEPWHWRYLWVEMATSLWNNNLTIAEYYKNN